MTVMEIADEGLLVGLDASAETDPSRERFNQKARHILLLSILVVAQLGAWAAFGYAAYVFVLA